MRKLVFTLFVLYSTLASTQNATTFEIEKLQKPTQLLRVESQNDIYKGFILLDAGLQPFEINRQKDFPYNIIAQNKSVDSLVSFGYNPFFNGMYRAYADHRPFVLSPDMIWLLISQGFVRHINADSEVMRNHLVDFNGKQTLLVESQKGLDDPTILWEKIVPDFTSQIKKNTKKKLVDLLTCDFSTTTSLERIASEITIMEATKPYFEFIVFRIVCGIPTITLEGTPQDWEKVLSKARKLKEYNLEWWISELEPLLKEFIKASKKEVNKEFWRNMFKYHTPKQYGAPEIIDGWIVKFFPYDKKGKRNNLKQLKKDDSLPNEIVKVDVNFIEIDNNATKTTPLEIWAGFIGLKQNNDNFALRPQIGWMIKKKDIPEHRLETQIKEQLQNEFYDGHINIRVNKFPPLLLKFKTTKIRRLSIDFIDNINIPDEFANAKIEILELSGKITDKEQKRIQALFPNTQVTINRK